MNLSKLFILITLFLLFNNSFGQWLLTPCPTTNNLNAVHFANNNVGYAVGNNGTLIKTTDQGNTWLNLNSSFAGTLSSVHCTNADTVFISCHTYKYDSAQILLTHNGGVYWSKSSFSFQNGRLNSIYSTPPGFVCAAGAVNVHNSFSNTYEDFALGCISKNNALTWNMAGGGTAIFGNSNPNSGWYLVINSICFVDTLTGYSCGNNIISKTINGGNSWTYLNNYNGNSIYFVNNNVGYVAGDNGVIRKTIDGGNTWITQNTGFTQKLNSIYFASPDSGCAVGATGIILGTIDGGNHWLQQYSPTIQDYTSVYFTDANTGYIVGTNGTILKNINGPVGIKEIRKNSAEFVFAPNPATDIVEVHSTIYKGILSVFNNIGIEVKQLPFNSSNFNLNVNDLPKGLYILRMVSENTTVVHKMIKE